MNFSLSHRDVWLLAATIILCVSIGYSIALIFAGNAMGKAPLQCPATCTGDNCPLHQVTDQQ
ncbi:MAG TPA: hypothetical protein VJB82_00605 [Candidatus Peribacterales bacterium]|nr:hypothetical protein [Candidatus Peribacterales bacterium]